MNDLKILLTEIFTSKKALAAIVGLAMIGAQKAGLAISEETLYQILGVIGTYIVGQGIADVGKPAAKAAADASSKLQEPSPVIVSVFADSTIPTILQNNPRLIPFTEKVLEAKVTEINEKLDEILNECSIDLADTVVPGVK